MVDSNDEGDELAEVFHEIGNDLLVDHEPFLLRLFAQPSGALFELRALASELPAILDRLTALDAQLLARGDEVTPGRAMWLPYPEPDGAHGDRFALVFFVHVGLLESTVAIYNISRLLR